MRSVLAGAITMKAHRATFDLEPQETGVDPVGRCRFRLADGADDPRARAKSDLRRSRRNPGRHYRRPFEEFYVQNARGRWFRSIHPLKSMLIYVGIVAATFILSLHFVRLLLWNFDDLGWIYRAPNKRGGSNTCRSA
jgi:hypothetical protein